MNYNVHNNIEEILNLNNKINNDKNDINIDEKEIDENQENEENQIQIEKENKEDKDEDKDKEDSEKKMDEEEDEDNREIYKMFEDKLYKNDISINNEKKEQDQIKMKENKTIQITSIKNQQSRLMNKYF